MPTHRLLQVVALVVALAVFAATSGTAAASAPAAPERSVAPSHCLAILRLELGAVLPSAWSGYQEASCSLTGESSASLATLENPRGQWIGPGTVAAVEKALGGQSAGLAALENPRGQWIGPETVAAAEKAFKAAVYGPPGR